MEKQGLPELRAITDRCFRNEAQDAVVQEGRIRQVPAPVVYPDGRMDRPNTALYIGVSADTLANWASLKKGPPYIRLGGKTFYFKQKVDEYIKLQQNFRGD